MERRNFLKYTAAMTVGTGLLGQSAFAGEKKAKAKMRKAAQLFMLPKSLSDAEKIKMAKDYGFEALEVKPMDDLKAAERLGKLAADGGVPVHSIIYGGWGKVSLTDPDPAGVKKVMDGLENALHCAEKMGADAVLLVPARVTENVSYADAYKRSQDNIAKLVPLAEQLGVVIALENVWNKFLLSPIEFARYIDEFDSPSVKAYFDTGNIVLYGYPQDWIRTLGKRICKIHLKDFKRKGYTFTNLLEGDVNWKQVRCALDEVGYEGYLTPERGGNKDEAFLKAMSERVDKIIAMK